MIECVHTSDRSRCRQSTAYVTTCRYQMAGRICTAQIDPMKYVLDLADDPAFTRQHELDITDQESSSPETSRYSGGNR